MMEIKVQQAERERKRGVYNGMFGKIKTEQRSSWFAS